MSPVETILCAYDFSETASLALQHSTRLARRHDARIVLAHVVEPTPLGPHPAISTPSSDLAIREIAERRMNEVAEEIRASGRRVDVVVPLGEPGPKLVEVANEVGAHLAVIGTRGLTGVRHVLLGSTAESVVRRAPMPVLTVHPGDTRLDDPIETIVVPTDLSPAAAVATEAFVDLFAKGPKPRILLVYAHRMPPYLEPFKQPVLDLTGQPDPIDEDFLERMTPVAKALEAEGFDVACHVVQGEAAEAVPDFAEEHDASMIVLSTHGRSAVINALLGRTAQRIVQRAPCPTLTVRARR